VPIGLAVLSPSLHLLYWSSTMEHITGIEASRAVGKPLTELNPIWSKPHYAGRLAHLFAGGPPVVFSPLLHPHLIPTQGSADRSFQVKATAVPDGAGAWWAILSVEEITVLARRVEELRVLHAQQDRLMREIHHRVKNNLNMISGLISLQKNTLEGAAVTALDDLQSRVVAIAEIHDVLYRSPGLQLGSTANYLEHLAHLLDENLSLNRNHRLVLELDRDCTLKTDTVVLLGLILAELVTNALKYGLGRQVGECLWIRLAKTEPRAYRFEVAHSGNRLPAGFDPASTSGLGMLLLTSYAAQLGSRLEWEAMDQTRFWVSFNE
jgi:two-component sensor histidine kinase